MADRLRQIAATGLVVGAVLGIAGTFTSSASLRGLAWGVDARPLALVSASTTMPAFIKGVGLLAALLFTAVAVQIFMGGALTPLSKPLPFFAYPFLAATLLGWAWVHYRGAA